MVFYRPALGLGEFIVLDEPFTGIRLVNEESKHLHLALTDSQNTDLSLSYKELVSLIHDVTRGHDERKARRAAIQGC